MSNYGNLNINRNKNRKGKKIIIALILYCGFNTCIYILYRYYSRKQQRQIQPNSRRNSRKYGIKVKGKRT